MTQFLKIPLLFIGLLFLTLSCRSDSGNINNDIFSGLFTGEVEYSQENIIEILDEAMVEVIREGDLLYSFHFSNNIPPINNVEFESNRGVLMNVEATEAHLIRVTAKTLQIIFSDEEGNHWKAQCFRDVN